MLFVKIVVQHTQFYQSGVCLGLWCLNKHRHPLMSQVWREVVGCRNWSVMWVPQFIALRRNESSHWVQGALSVSWIWLGCGQASDVHLGTRSPKIWQAVNWIRTLSPANVILCLYWIFHSIVWLWWGDLHRWRIGFWKLAWFSGGKHFNKYTRIHPFLFAALSELHIQQFLSNNYQGDLPQVIKDLLSEDKNDETYFANCPPQIEAMLHHYEQYCHQKRNGAHGKTAQFAMVYMDVMRNDLLDRPLRTCDVDLYTYAKGSMLPLFWAACEIDRSSHLIVWVSQCYSQGGET